MFIHCRNGKVKLSTTDLTSELKRLKPPVKFSVIEVKTQTRFDSLLEFSEIKEAVEEFVEEILKKLGLYLG